MTAGAARPSAVRAGRRRDAAESEFERRAVAVMAGALDGSYLGPGGLAIAAGVSDRRLADIMACRAPMSVREFVRLCRALGLGIEDFAQPGETTRKREPFALTERR